MPDPTNDVNIVVRTEPESAKLREFEEQLKKDLANARKNDLPDFYPDTISHKEAFDRLGIPWRTAADPNPPRAPGVATIGTVIRNIVQDSIRAAQQALGFKSPAAQVPGQKPGESKTSSPATNTPPKLPGHPPLPAATNRPAITVTNLPIAPSLPPGPGANSSHVPINIPFPQNNRGTGGGDFASPFASGDNSSGAISAQTQSLQASGERLRATLEQNASLTNSLFLRALDVMNQQNQKLGEVDRKISELSGQIKSLKNP
jgi:hypothetical protein